MLTDSERTEIEATLAHYPHRRSAASGAMRIVQRHRGFLSDEALADIGAFLGVSVEELDSRATFANMLFRHPVGRHVILICDSDCCYVMAYEQMRDHISARLGIGPRADHSRRALHVPAHRLPGAVRPRSGHAGRRRLSRRPHPERIDEILARYE